MSAPLPDHRFTPKLQLLVPVSNALDKGIFIDDRARVAKSGGAQRRGAGVPCSGRGGRLVVLVWAGTTAAPGYRMLGASARLCPAVKCGIALRRADPHPQMVSHQHERSSSKLLGVGKKVRRHESQRATGPQNCLHNCRHFLRLATNVNGQALRPKRPRKSACIRAPRLFD